MILQAMQISLDENLETDETRLETETRQDTVGFTGSGLIQEEDLWDQESSLRDQEQSLRDQEESLRDQESSLRDQQSSSSIQEESLRDQEESSIRQSLQGGDSFGLVDTGSSSSTSYDQRLGQRQ